MADESGDYEVQELDPRVFQVPEFLPGQKVQITIGSTTKHAEVRFVGPLTGMKGFWLGVGKNDGQHNKRRYFLCPPGHGGFVRASKATLSERDDASASPPADPAGSAEGAAEGGGEGSAGAEALTYATGPGLGKAVVGSLSQFTIVTFDSSGQKADKGGEDVAVVIRGRSAADHSQPALMRTKLIDRGDGTYMCEYRPWLTGSFSVSITMGGAHIKGSPYELSVITLRPDASRCIVRGEALHKAVARTPMKFEALFVDGMGHPAQAEDLDVWVDPFEGGGQERGFFEHVGEAVTETVASVGQAIMDGVEEGVNAMERATGWDIDQDGDPLDAPTRQRHLQLWASRIQADKLLAKAKAARAEAGSDQGKKKGIEPRAPTSFAHEMNMNREAFAFGGLDPGTLHAHGKLVKVHAVHYSVGLAGRYKLHVGLRQQMQPLPGSPFELLVEPGSAYAASSKLPAESLPLSGLASEELQHGLTFQTSDMMGNLCVHGGADISAKLGRGAEHGKDAEAVELSVVDNSDGSYQLKWKGKMAGTYPVDVLINGAHVGGSPTQLIVGSAEPAVEQMTVSGLGMSKAIAGNDAQLHISVADRFGNRFEPEGTQSFPYTFGLILNPAAAAGEFAKSAADKKKAAKFQEKDPGARAGLRVEDERKATSLPFEGRWNGLAYEISYVAKEAGTMDLHVWAATRKPASGDSPELGGAMIEQRTPLPGSPFSVHVSEGNASAVGSSVGEAEAGKQGAGFVAGENVILRPQIRDSFGNASNPPEGALSAEHIFPANEKNVDTWEELPPPKLKGGLGSYELVIEPTRAGEHFVHIKLHGQDITGSPVPFHCAPAAPSSSKCRLKRILPPEDEYLIEKQPIEVRVTLFDRYGNQLDHGGVRVDAKASGIGVSGAKVEDNKDGTYTISLVAGPPGEIKIAIRIDGNELPPYLLNVQKSPERAEGEPAATTAAAKDAETAETAEGSEADETAPGGAPEPADVGDS